MLINMTKTKVVHVRNKACERTKVKFNIGESILELVPEYRYLGLQLHKHMDFDITVKSLADGANRALGSVIGRTRDNYDLNFASYLQLYHSCVVPIMDYCAGVWGVNGKFTALDSIQHRAIRYYCGVPSKTAVLGYTGDMGWDPIIVRRDVETLRMYNQIVKMSVDRLPRIIMEYDNEQGGQWSNNLKQLLHSLDMTDHWNDRIPINIDQTQSSLRAMYQENSVLRNRSYIHLCNSRKVITLKHIYMQIFPNGNGVSYLRFSQDHWDWK